MRKTHFLLARLGRLTWAFVFCICDKYISFWHGLVDWPGPSFSVYASNSFPFGTVGRLIWAFVFCICENSISWLGRLTRAFVSCICDQYISFWHGWVGWAGPSFSVYAIITFPSGTAGKANLGLRFLYIRSIHFILARLNRRSWAYVFCICDDNFSLWHSWVGWPEPSFSVYAVITFPYSTAG